MKTSPPIPASVFFATRDALDEALAETEKNLKAIPGCGSGPMGLTPEHVRATPEWKAARVAFDRAFAAVRQFNGQYVKYFKAEIRQRIDEKRAAKLKA